MAIITQLTKTAYNMPSSGVAMWHEVVNNAVRVLKASPQPSTMPLAFGSYNKTIIMTSTNASGFTAAQPTGYTIGTLINGFRQARTDGPFDHDGEAVLYVSYSKLSELTTLPPKAHKVYYNSRDDLGAIYEPWNRTQVEEYRSDSIQANVGTKDPIVIVDACVYWSNSGLPRARHSDLTIAPVYYMTSFGQRSNYDASASGSVATYDCDAQFSIFTSNFLCPSIMANAPRDMAQVLSSYMPMFDGSAYSKYAHYYLFSDTEYIGGNLVRDIAKPVYLVMRDVSELKAFLKTLGCPYSFTLDEAQNKEIKDFTDYKPPGIPDNGEGGGDGDGDNDSDPTPLVIPTITPADTFNRSYALSPNQTDLFADWLWTSTFVDDIKLLTNNPIENIVSLHFMPFDLSAHAALGDDVNISVGNVKADAMGAIIPSGYNEVFDMGSIAISPYYGSFLDYSPYTKIQIYLPYIGIRQLDANDVMGATVRIEYIIDVTNGATTAVIRSNERLIYTASGNVAIPIPISNTNANERLKALATSIAGAAGTAINIGSSVAGAAKAGKAAIIGEVFGSTGDIASAAGNIVKAAENHVNSGGVISPDTALYMPQQAFLIITRPKIAKPAQYAQLKGFPTSYSGVVGDFVGGFFVADDVRLDQISATAEEKTLIMQQLTRGVFI